MKCTEIFSTIFFFTCMLVSVSLINNVKSNIIKECEDIQTDIDALNEQISEKVNSYQNEKERLHQNDIDLKLLCLWLKEPTRSDFEKMTKIAETVNISRENLLKRYIDYEMLQNYMTYISKDGVRTYLASVVRRRLLPPIEYDLENAMYSPNMTSHNVKIPDSALARRYELEGFLSVMENQYPFSKKR